MNQTPLLAPLPRLAVTYRTLSELTPDPRNARTHPKRQIEQIRASIACYLGFAFRQACRELGLKHVRTRPYTPRTNGKAERFIQTALREWAYAQAYPTSDRRAEEFPVWLHQYNWHRPHGGINSQPPISRLGLTEDNLLMLHS
jgi:transposase InsO family protein